MKSMFRGLALAVALIVPAVSQAEMLIDNFNTAGATGATGSVATRSVANVVTSVATFGVGGADLKIQANVLTGGNLDVKYNWASGLEPTLYIDQHVLKLAVGSAEGDWQVTVTTKGLGGSGADGSMVATIADGFAGTTFLDLWNTGNLGHLNGLQALTLNFKSLTGSGLGNRVLTLGNLSAAPEPASMVLLGLTAVGGVFANRRRKKTVVA